MSVPTFSQSYRFFGYSEARRLELALSKKKNPALAVLKGDDDKVRSNFKDTTYWNAVVHTDQNGHATIRVSLADNLTTWRVTAIAVTPDTKVGQATSSFIARKELMITAGLPRYMIRGAAQTVVAHVANLTNKPAKTVVTISADGAHITGESSRIIDVLPGKTVRTYFTIQLPDDASSESVRLVLKADAGAGLADAARQTVPLVWFGAKKSSDVLLSVKQNNGSADGTVTLSQKYADPVLTIRLSPGSGEALKQSLEYLADYPYGCIEQTMSRFMPLIAAEKAGCINARLKTQLPIMIATGTRAYCLASEQRRWIWLVCNFAGK